MAIFETADQVTTKPVPEYQDIFAYFLPDGEMVRCSITQFMDFLKAQGFQFTAPGGTALAISINQTNVTTYGGNDGSITAAGLGGSGSYQYRIDGGVWSVAKTTSHTFSNLTAGAKNVDLRDANDITKVVSATVTLSQPAATNTAPTATGTSSNIALTSGYATHSILLSNHFSDTDSLTYSIVSNSNPGMLTASAPEPVEPEPWYLYLTEVGGTGTAEVVVRATDTGGLTVDKTFTVTVQAASANTITGGTIDDSNNTMTVSTN